MTEFTHELGVMLGRILERSEKTVESLGHINNRMDKADEWRGQASGQLIGIQHRLKAVERSYGKQKPSPPRAERLFKKIIAASIPASLMWLIQPAEHAMDVLKAVMELLKAMKGGG